MRLLTDPLRRRWLVFTALAGAFLIVNVLRLSTGVLTEDLARLYGATATQIGTLHSSFFYVYAPLQVVAGVLADRAGIRRTAATGTLLMGVSALAFAFAPTYSVALVARVVIGLGGSVVFIATLRFLANWFRPDEFATMTGATMAIAGIGGMVATTPLALAVESAGTRTALAGVGVAGLVAALGVAVLARDTPEAAGLPAIRGVPSAPTQTLEEVLSNVRVVGTTPRTWVVSLTMFAALGVNITILGVWGVPYVAQTYDLSTPAASTYALVGGLGMVLGPPTIGRLSDRLGRRTELMVAGGVVFTLLFAVLSLTRPPLPVVGFIFFVTASLGGAFSLGYTVVKEAHDTGASGVSTGFVNAIAFSGAAVFPPVMGLLLDGFWTGEVTNGVRQYPLAGFQMLFALAAAAGLFATVLSLVVHYRTPSRGETPAAAD